MPRLPSLAPPRRRRPRTRPLVVLPVEREVPTGRALWLLPAAATAAVVVLLAGAAARQPRVTDGALSALTSPGAWWTEGGLALLAVLTFLCFYWPRRRQPRSFTLVVSLTLGMVALVLGLASYVPCGTGAPASAPLIWTIGLFFGSLQDVWSGGGCTGQRPLASSVAELAALLTTAVGFIAVLAATTRDQWDRLRVRLARSVVVVAGLDDVTLPVVLALRRKSPGDVIAVLDPDVAQPRAVRARTAGARVVAGELADPLTAAAAVLRRGRLKARAVYLVSPDPSVNLERLTTLVAHLPTSGRPSDRRDGVPSRIVVRVDDPWLVEEQRRTALDARYRPWVLEAVSIYETTARTLADRAARTGGSRLLLVGSGPLTLALLSELARRERELATARQLEIPPEVLGLALPERVLVLAPDADELLRDHQDQQARFGNAAASAPEAVPAEVTGPAVAGLVGDQAWHVIVTSAPSPETALLASRLASRHPGCTVDVWTETTTRSSGTSGRERPHVFALTLTQPDGRLGDDTWEHVARLAHERHRLSFPASPGAEVAPSRRAWEELPAFYRESGLRQIRTVLEAVTARGRSWGPATDGGADVELSSDDLDAVSAAEHSSWEEYYRRSGWRPAPADAPSDPVARRHPMLRPWEQLTQEEQQRTYRGVQRTVQLLRTLGYRPVLHREDGRGA